MVHFSYDASALHHLQACAADCAALSEEELAPLATLPLESLSLACCWNFEVGCCGARKEETIIVVGSCWFRLMLAYHVCPSC